MSTPKPNDPEAGTWSAFLWDQLRTHGLSFVLLALAVGYFQQNTRELTQELKLCNQEILELYREDRVKMLEIISNNTRAVNQLTQAAIRNGDISDK